MRAGKSESKKESSLYLGCKTYRKQPSDRSPSKQYLCLLVITFRNAVLLQLPICTSFLWKSYWETLLSLCVTEHMSSSTCCNWRGYMNMGRKTKNVWVSTKVIIFPIVAKSSSVSVCAHPQVLISLCYGHPTPPTYDKCWINCMCGCFLTEG